MLELFNDCSPEMNSELWFVMTLSVFRQMCGPHKASFSPLSVAILIGLALIYSTSPRGAIIGILIATLLFKIFTVIITMGIKVRRLQILHF